MTYYKIKPEFDQKKRREKECFNISNNAVVPVQVSKRAVYWFFGARFV